MGSQKKKTGNHKIVRYRRPKNINVGMIIFAIIFVYMSFSVYTYLKREKVQVYEVVEGSIVNEKAYTGIILREESTKYTDRAGYINYIPGRESGPAWAPVFIPLTRWDRCQDFLPSIRKLVLR